jgi:hypothetical protein
VYEIPTKTGTRYFKTVDLLSHQRVVCITGRKTRVWSAIEVKGLTGSAATEEDNSGQKVVLKDVWLDEGSKTEKEKLDAIFKSLSTIKEEAYSWAGKELKPKLKAAFKDQGYKEYFMEIICDSFELGKSKERLALATPAPGILQFDKELYDDRGYGNDAEDPATTNLVEDRTMLTGTTQNTVSTYTDRNNRRNISDLKGPLRAKTRSYQVKQQYRLVYKEVGQSVDRVDSLGTAFTALSDAYIGESAHYV